MADIANRDKYERDMAAIIVLLLSQHESQWKLGLAMSGFQHEASDAIAAILAAAFVDGATAATGELSIDIGGLDSSASSWAKAYSPALARAIADAVLKRGLTLDKLRAMAPDDPQLLDLTAWVLSEATWDNIATTEVTRAVSSGSEYAAAMWFLLMAQPAEAYWHTSLDKRVCPVCSKLSNKPRSYWSLVAPQGPPVHPRCRCWIDYIPGGIRRAA